MSELPPRSPEDDSEPSPSPGDDRSLTVAWRWILALAWGVIMAAIGSVAQAGFIVDDGPFWLSVKPLPFAIPTAVLVALSGNWRRTLTLSALATVSTAAIALVDVLADHLAVGVSEAICALAGLLATVAALASRPRPTRSTDASTPPTSVIV
jgi:hypothetical protein